MNHQDDSVGMLSDEQRDSLASAVNAAALHCKENGLTLTIPPELHMEFLLNVCSLGPSDLYTKELRNFVRRAIDALPLTMQERAALQELAFQSVVESVVMKPGANDG